MKKRYRDHYCGMVSLDDIGKDVKVCGYVDD